MKVLSLAFHLFLYRNFYFDDDFLDFFGGVDAELRHVGILREEEGEGGQRSKV